MNHAYENGLCKIVIASKLNKVHFYRKVNELQNYFVQVTIPYRPRIQNNTTADRHFEEKSKKAITAQDLSPPIG